ncbi:MAG TPA: hypothetical protein VIO14_02505 [Dehalococcoidia bacterium]
MKRWILALVAGGVVGGAVFGAAATLGGITADTLSADSVAVLSCDTDGVTTSYTTAYEAAISAYEVDDLTVDGINAACNGYDLKVTLYTAGGASLAEQIVVGIDATTEVLDFSTNNVDAEDVDGVAVVIDEP